MALMLANQRITETEELKLETEMLRLEMRSVVDQVMELGGDAVVGG